LTEIVFDVPGEFCAWSRTGTKGGQRFTPLKQRNYMAVLRDYAERAMAGRAPLSGPVELSVTAIYPWPKSKSEKKRNAPGAKWKTSRPDADNLLKIVKDSLNAITYQDDAQAARCLMEKHYGERSLLRVRVVSLDR
jgi:Holliday junction resolvase RusA-like endonuclease